VQGTHAQAAHAVNANAETTLKPKAIQLDFPFEQLDPIAELESWRKELNRPPYHIHKWWAQRLGTVFRAILLGIREHDPAAIWDRFYDRAGCSDTIVLDPFMGSGTTLGESLKLGMKVVGCDINPVSTFAVRQALQAVDAATLEAEFRKIEADIRDPIQELYTTLDPSSGLKVPALYYFWVKIVRSPHGEDLPLFSTHVFAKHATPAMSTECRIICPACWAVFRDDARNRNVRCQHCGRSFDPHSGTAVGAKVRDSLGREFKIKELVLAEGGPPRHRLYAVMAATGGDGDRQYFKPSEFDHERIRDAEQRLKSLERDLPLPTLEVLPGINTDQARGYRYTTWRSFFFPRQLLALGLLLQRIQRIPAQKIREQFLCLFSSTLEFNNQFCSYKGEGTGAVRHMFSHHILKPEKMPLENSIWGTSQSSGTFPTLFRSRLLRAKAYLERPFELKATDTAGRLVSTKVFCGDSLKPRLVNCFADLQKGSGTALVLNGDSSKLPLPNASVDAVVTDPPYFDFVHYSELSDFFFAWLAPVLAGTYEYFYAATSRRHGEVQEADPTAFGQKLSCVFTECHRVLKDDGLLVFSFHHSRADAWQAIFRAIRDAGFGVLAAHPVKAEMSVGTPKTGTADPITVDVLLVCSKSQATASAQPEQAWVCALGRLQGYLERFQTVGRCLGQSDQRVILAGQVLREASGRGLSVETANTLVQRVFSAWQGIEMVVGYSPRAEPSLFD
jgi:putative DNA methylase